MATASVIKGWGEIMSGVEQHATRQSVLPVLLTVEEVAALLRVEVATIYVWTSKRKIPFRKVGGRLRFDRDEVLRWTTPKE